MNATRILVRLVFLCFALGVDAEEPYTPKPGSNERKAICDGLRAFITQEYAEKKLPKPIVLKIEYLKVSGDYCFIECSPQFEDGTDVIPEYLPDMGYTHCMKRVYVGWHVIIDMSRTDVPDAEERAKIKKSFPGDFPWELLSPEWQKTFAGKYD